MLNFIINLKFIYDLISDSELDLKVKVMTRTYEGTWLIKIILKTYMNFE